MLSYLVEFIGGLILLTWGADRFVNGASAIARKLGVRPLLIGLTIVSFATSAPEIMVSVFAAMRGEPDLAIGNAIGSNIINIGLVLGLVAVIRPIQMSSVTVRREMWALLAVTALLVVLILDSYLSRFDGLVLMASLVFIIIWMVRLGLRKSAADDPITAEFEAEIPEFVSGKATIFQLVFGLAALLVGAEFLVNGSIHIAQVLGVSEIVIGIVLVAFGTSLPELAVSLVSIVRREYGLALGNIVGSNIFNSLAVVGIASFIAPSALPPSALTLHVPAMVIFTLLLFATTFDHKGKEEISRREGLFLLATLFAYEIYTVVPELIA